MPIKAIETQRRMAEMGRVRLGEEKKDEKRPGKPLEHFRFTSASTELLDAVAAEYGGTVEPWQAAPDAGMFQVYSEADRIDVIIPSIFSDVDGEPSLAYSQWYELWTGGGCQRRCDGETEAISGGKPCMCGPLVAKGGEDARVCKATTRVKFMLMVGMSQDPPDPKVVGFGVWRLESHGWNAAVEMPGVLEALQAAAEGQKFVPATIRIEHRSKVVDGQTRRFIVPVIGLRSPTIAALPGMQSAAALAGGRLALNAPAAAPKGRPALPAGPGAPAGDAARFEHDQPPEHGAPPPLPGQPDEPDGDDDVVDAEVVESMTADEFARSVKQARIPTVEQKKILGQLFPGRAYASLDDEERGRLWAAIRPQEQLPVTA